MVCLRQCRSKIVSQSLNQSMLMLACTPCVILMWLPLVSSWSPICSRRSTQSAWMMYANIGDNMSVVHPESNSVYAGTPLIMTSVHNSHCNWRSWTSWSANFFSHHTCKSWSQARQAVLGVGSMASWKDWTVFSADSKSRLLSTMTDHQAVIEDHILHVGYWT